MAPVWVFARCAARYRLFYATPGHAFAARDRALAGNHRTLWLSDTRVARQVAEAIRAGENRRFYELSAWVVMPNHVHLLILPHVALPQITHWIKGKTAREANLLLKRAGQPFWQHESYDHWARNERELQWIAAYIEDNPVSAGLAATPEDWPCSSATSQAQQRQAKACPTKASHAGNSRDGGHWHIPPVTRRSSHECVVALYGQSLPAIRLV